MAVQSQSSLMEHPHGAGTLTPHPLAGHSSTGNDTPLLSPLAPLQVQSLLPGSWARGWGGPEVSMRDPSSLPALSPQPPAAPAGLSRTQCLGRGGHLLGTSCQYVPDVTLVSFLLFGGTFLSCTAFKRFRSSRYFPAGVSILWLPWLHGHLSW